MGEPFLPGPEARGRGACTYSSASAQNSASFAGCVQSIVKLHWAAMDPPPGRCAACNAPEAMPGSSGDGEGALGEPADLSAIASIAAIPGLGAANRISRGLIAAALLRKVNGRVRNADVRGGAESGMPLRDNGSARRRGCSRFACQRSHRPGDPVPEHANRGMCPGMMTRVWLRRDAHAPLTRSARFT
jgi:hypothetical protein